MQTAEVNAITGTVKKVVAFKADSNWALLSVNVGRGRSESVIGHVLCAPFEGMALEALGGHETHPRFGQQFNASEIVLKPPTDKSKLADYIQHISPGFNHQEAWKIAHFPGDLATELVPGIPPEKAARFQQIWKDRDLDPVGIANLRSVGYSTQVAIQVARYFRDINENLTTALEKNPYRALEAEISWKIVDEASLRMGWSHDAPERIMAGLNEGARRWSNDGHTICTREELRSKTVELLKVDPFQIDKLIERAVEEKSLSLRDDLGEEPRYQLPAHFKAENSIAYDAYRLGKARPKPDFIPTAAQIAEATGFEPDPEQIEAIKLVFERGFSILTGGPGCGKTAIVRALCELYPGGVHLIAPTGMAAKRLSEATGRGASTIHRFLGGTPEGDHWRFAFSRSNPLEIEDALFVIDEGSMLDTTIGSALFAAIQSNNTVLLVGDADQLPSVGPGQVLADLIQFGVPTTSLTRIHRQGLGSPIPYVAREIIEGREPQLGTTGMVRLIESRRDDEATQVYAVIRGMIKAGVGCDDVRVISPMKMGPYGVDQLNAHLQPIWNPMGVLREGVEGAILAKGKSVDEYDEDPFGHENQREMLYPMDRVLMTKNDHERQVYNGDILHVVECGHEGAKRTPWIKAQTDDGQTLEYKGKKLVSSFRLAYATTVHKAQGSQYPHIILALVKGQRRMLQRRLVYTAITRAQQSMTVVGHGEAIGMACRDAGGVAVRSTGLKELMSSGAYKANLGIVDEPVEELSVDEERMSRALETHAELVTI